MFKSEKGFYLLDQGFQLTYVGADVEAYNAQTVTDADVVPGTNQVRFLTDDGRTLMFDYYFKQWSTFIGHEGLASTVWGDAYVYAQTSGRVGIEAQGVYQDFGSAITMAIEPAWMKLAGIQGFQRVSKVILLGHYISPHRLRVSYQYDYEVGLPNVYEWDPATVVNTTTYGAGATYGDDTPYGGTGSSTYQAVHGLRYQKCQAVRFRIEDVVNGDSPGASFVLSDLTLMVGGLGGIFRTNPTRRFGTPVGG